MARPRKLIDPEQVEKLAAFSLNPDEIAFVLDIPVVDILNQFSHNIRSSWPNDEEFKRVRKRRLVRSIGIEFCHKLFPTIFSDKSSLKNRISSALRATIKHTFGGYPDNLEQELGYSLDELIENFNDKFKEGMSWDNWGEWHIDHIEPRHRFKKKTIKECFALKNLQPLWRIDNLRKGTKWDGLKQ